MVHRKSWGRIVTIVILGLAVMCAPASSQQFSTPKNVSNNSDFSFTPQLAVDLGGNIYVVWEDDTNTNSNILFRRSTDGGATFSAPRASPTALASLSTLALQWIPAAPSMWSGRIVLTSLEPRMSFSAARAMRVILSPLQ